MSVIFYHDDQQKKLAEDSLKVNFGLKIISRFYFECFISVCPVGKQEQHNDSDPPGRDILQRRGVRETYLCLNYFEQLFIIIISHSSYHQKYMLRKHDWLVKVKILNYFLCLNSQLFSFSRPSSWTTRASSRPQRPPGSTATWAAMGTRLSRLGS